ncbi:MAG: ABC transporter ATP-binding protein [Anaerolineae bacterium]|nr:ABC transporter ATP-binding protein [Anaerolineae bacterium]
MVKLRLRKPKQTYWVLRNINFGIEPGEMLGLIGVNGSGKSTVLKLLSRIIEPTTGRVVVDGRISALLELGAGFHPDLTGRENVYLNGSILGLSRKEIRQKLDDIVRFADLESSIDIPVRFYSSGMYMRLGFSVATHANPEILLVDEVLAVGDYAFQLRCLHRIEELKKQGMTTLFVSHDMEAIKDLCDRVIWLDGGGIQAEGDPEHVVEQYLRGFADVDLGALGKQSGIARGQRWGTGEVEITSVRFLDGNGNEKSCFVTGEPFRVAINYVAHKRIKSPVFGMGFYSSDGTWINGSNTSTSKYEIGWVEGKGSISYCQDQLPLLEGSYLFSATAYDFNGDVPHAYDHLDKAFVIQIRPSSEIGETLGMVYMPCHWEHTQ